MEADPENFAAQQKDREGNLPIHSACERRKPNGAVISMLADMFPGGLQQKDKDGNLPLHSALEVGDAMPVDIIRKLLGMFPGATAVRDRDSNLPLHCCFHANKVLMVEELLSRVITPLIQA